MINKDVQKLAEAYNLVTKNKTLASYNEATQPSEMKDWASPAPYSNTYEHDKKVMLLRRLSNGEINKINNNEQYIVTWKNPEKHNNQQEQPLKGESVLAFMDDIASIHRAFVKQ